MILEISLGVTALVAAGFAAKERATARRSQDEARQLRGLADQAAAALHAAEQARDEALAQAAQQAGDRAAAEAHSSRTAREAQAVLEAARRERAISEAEQERAAAQLQRLERALARAEAERASLSKALEEAMTAIPARVEAERARDALGAKLLQAERELRAAHKRLEEAQQELTRLRNEASRAPSLAVFGRNAEATRRAESLAAEVEALTARAEAAEAELAQRQRSTVEEELRAERDSLLAKIDAQQEQSRQIARAQATFQALGLPATPRDARLFSRERRGASEGVLRDTYIAAQAAGAGLFDPRGVGWARFGNPAIVERLAASAAILGASPAAEALGAPVQLISELYGVYGRHFVTLPGADLVLGLTGSRECPALALRVAALQLVGPAPATPASGAVVQLTLDPDRSERLDAWALRRGALGVALFAEGEPAGTDSTFVGACAPLVPIVTALYSRVRRDHFGVGFAVLWRAEDDITLAALALGEGGSVVFARFDAPPAPRILDDLAATTRWLATPIAVAS